MEVIRIAQQNYVDVRRSDEFLGIRGCFRDAACYFSAAVLESLLGCITEVGDLVVFEEVVQDGDVADL